MTRPFKPAPVPARNYNELALPSSGVEMPPETKARLEAELAEHPCGECQECCYIAGVEDPKLSKPGFQRCEHQCAAGCAIYDTKPNDCTEFACLWKMNVVATQRPDICGVMWFIGANSDGARTLNLELDFERAGIREIAEAMLHVEEFHKRGQSVFLRVRGDEFSIVLQPGQKIGIMARRWEGETDAEQVQRTHAMAPLVARRWEDIRSACAKWRRACREAESSDAR